MTGSLPNRFRPIKLKWWAFRRWWLTLRYARKMSGPGSPGGGMLPKLGKGQFVSVEQRGPFLEMTDERTSDVIRLVPYQPNHGVMVELWIGGESMSWRVHCSSDDFRRMGFDEGERPR